MLSFSAAHPELFTHRLNQLTLIYAKDIQLLYDIIRQAESSDLPPFRALFTAYDRLLREYGIQKDHDQIYFRFLLRLGETKGDSLFERFEGLLQKLGFEIKFDGEDEDPRSAVNGNIDRERDTEREAAHTDRRKNRVEEETHTRRPSRRASFDSAYDTRDDSRRSDMEGIRPSPPRSHSTDIMQRQEYVQKRQHQKPPHAQPRLSEYQQSHAQADIPTRGRLRQRGISRQLNGHQRKISVSRSRDYQDAHRRPAPSAQVHPNHYEFEASDEEGLSEPDDMTLGEAAHLPPMQSAPVEADYAQLENHARILRYHHSAAHALGFFHNWRRRAIIKHNSNVQLYQVAANHDARTLLHQALDQWHTALLQRRHEQDTERFFEELSQKAQQARDLFLLTKAFTHWEAAAQEEVIRTTAARRHILRSRYFHAWRDITVTNEYKVRSARTKKVMNIWKRRTAQVLQYHREAEISRDNTAISRYYRHWFWHFCEQRAPAWYSTKFKIQLFGKWLDATRQARVRDSWAIESRNLELVRSTTAQWSRRSTVVMKNHERAEMFRRRLLIESNLEVLRTEMTLSPLLTRMVRVVDARVAKDALRVWITRLRLVVQAEKVHKLRVMRNTWSAWNDRLRCQALSRTIDDRIVMQALYKWVLAQRLKLFQRVRDERLKSKVYRTWHNTMNNVCASLGMAKYLAQQSRDRRSRRTVLEKWSTESQARTALIARAETMLDSKQLNFTFTAWTARLSRLQQIDTWANDARFFVLASRSIKKWQSSAANHQRNKRHDAYSVIRRKIKVALARRIFHKWQSRTAGHAPMHDSANQLAYERTLATLPDILQTWHDRSVYIAQSGDLALDSHARTISSTILTTLSAQLEQNATLASRATTFRRATIADAAASALRKINWAVFQGKRQDETAASLAERNRRKHYKSMLRYWRDGVEKRRRPVDRLLFQSVVGSGRIDQGNYAVASTMDFEDDLIDFSTVAPPALPIPATVLSARSKSRTRPMFRSSTVPPSPSENRPAPSASQQRPQQQGRPASALRALATAPTPGYLRTPSRRSAFREATNNVAGAQSRNRLHQLRRGEETGMSSEQLGTSFAPSTMNMLLPSSTTPAGLPPQQANAMSAATAVTPLASRLRNLGLGAMSAQPTMTQQNGTRPSRFSVARHTAFSDVDEDADEEERNGEEDLLLSPSRSRRIGGSVLEK